MIAQTYVHHDPPELTGGLYVYVKSLRAYLSGEFTRLSRALASGDAVQWAALDIPWSDFYLPSAKPDPDTTNLGLLFPQNTTSEKGLFSKVMPFNWYGAEGKATSVNPRVHFVQDTSSEAVFKLDYRLIQEGASPTASFTTVTASSMAVTYSSGTILQTAVFPAIAVSAPVGLVHVFDGKLYRDDNVVTGDVLTKGMTLLIEVNSLGARRIGQK